jgi:hypothetical protein
MPWAHWRQRTIDAQPQLNEHDRRVRELERQVRDLREVVDREERSELIYETAPENVGSFAAVGAFEAIPLPLVRRFLVHHIRFTASTTAGGNLLFGLYRGERRNVGGDPEDGARRETIVLQRRLGVVDVTTGSTLRRLDLEPAVDLDPAAFYYLALSATGDVEMERAPLGVQGPRRPFIVAGAAAGVLPQTVSLDIASSPRGSPWLVLLNRAYNEAYSLPYSLPQPD